MNPSIQNLLAIAALILALGYIITKFFLKKKNSKKPCGEEDCGCH